MAHHKNGTFLMMLVIAMLWAGGAVAQSSSCTNVILSLSPCLDYITGNSSTPSSGCCTQLSSVASSQPQCLCEALNGGGSNMGLNINQTQAEALPGACRVQTPPISQCNAASPGNSPSGTPGSRTPSGGGSNRVPATDNNSPSDASSTKMAIPMIFFLLFVSSGLNFDLHHVLSFPFC